MKTNQSLKFNYSHWGFHVTIPQTSPLTLLFFIRFREANHETRKLDFCSLIDKLILNASKRTRRKNALKSSDFFFFFGQRKVVTWICSTQIPLLWNNMGPFHNFHDESTFQLLAVAQSSTAITLHTKIWQWGICNLEKMLGKYWKFAPKTNYSSIMLHAT